GGSLTAITGIYDTMQYVRAPVATMCVGQAAADAAVLLAPGEPGQRVVLPHALVVLTQPAMEGGRGSVPALILAADEVVRQRGRARTSTGIWCSPPPQHASSAWSTPSPTAGRWRRGRSPPDEEGSAPRKKEGSGGEGELSVGRGAHHGPRRCWHGRQRGHRRDRQM